MCFINSQLFRGFGSGGSWAEQEAPNDLPAFALRSGSPSPAGGPAPVVFEGSGKNTVVRVRDVQSNIHNRWNNQLKPIAEVDEGDLVIFECRDGSDNQMSDRSTTADVLKLDFGRVHALSGPVYVRGAEPGDALEVEVVDVRPRYDYGWTSMLPGFGLVSWNPNAPVLDDPEFLGAYFRLWRSPTATR